MTTDQIDRLAGEIGLLAALVIAALAAALVVLWRAYRAEARGRLEDQKEHTAEIMSATDTLRIATEIIGGRHG